MSPPNLSPGPGFSPKPWSWSQRLRERDRSGLRLRARTKTRTKTTVGLLTGKSFPHNDAGLTLLEVVLAISIMSVLTLLCYRVLRQVTEAKIIVEEIDKSMTVGNSVITRIIRELQLATQATSFGIIPRCDRGTVTSTTSSGSTSGTVPGSSAVAATTMGGATPWLIGEQKSLGANARGDEITFVAREGGQYLPDGGRHSGMVQITYRVMPSSNTNSSGIQTYALVRDEMPYIRDQDKACQQAIVFPITEKLVSIEFNYYRKTTNDWHTEWGTSGLLKLPEAIDFTLQILSDSGRVESYSSGVALRWSP